MLLGTAASALGGAASTVASTAATAAGVGAVNSYGEMKNRSQKKKKKATGNISRQDIENWVAKNNDTFDQAQIHATVNVLEGMLNITQNDLSQMDFTRACP